MSRRTKLLLLPLLLIALAGLSVVLARMLFVSSALVLLATFGAVVIGTTVLYARMIVVARKLVLRSQEGVAWLNQGKAAEALAEFEACAAEAKRVRMVNYHHVFRANAAAAHIALGQPHHADAICRDLLRQPDLRRALANSWGNFIGIAASARLHQAKPELAKVASFLDAHEPDVPAAQRPALFGPRAIVLLRQGKAAEVDALLSHHWVEAEGILPARNLRRLRVLWAYALQQLGRGEESRHQLSIAGPTAPQEAAPLTQHWPNLAAFLTGTDQLYRQSAR